MNTSTLMRLKGKHFKDVFIFFKDKYIQKRRYQNYKKWMKSSIIDSNKENLYHALLQNHEVNNVDIKLAELYLNHVFDVLGSGPVCLNTEKVLKTFLSNQQISYKKIYTFLKTIRKDYKNIDWQLDFKNSYRFNGNKNSSAIEIKQNSGFDIKIPWELARCQHLPFLARLYSSTGKLEYKNEILCEILDFIASNPIGYGVNWKCAMDVAIRVSNWIMALDLIQEHLEKEVEEIISKSIYQHCIFIRYHLEDQRDYRGNHYLSDIVGLLFSSTFFSPEGIIREIQEFAIKQLFASIDEQFYEDGGNFESSLPYHRLSLELALFGLWRVLVLSESNELCHQCTKKIQNYKKQINKIGRACKLMLDAIKPNGNIYQLGDNDSGHLFRFYHYGEVLTPEQYAFKYGKKIKPTNNDSVWDENELNCSEIEAVINAILGRDGNKTIFYELLGKTFLASGIVPVLHSAFETAGNKTPSPKDPIDFTSLPFKRKKIIEFKKPIDLTNVKPFYYPEFGLVGIKNESVYLGVSITGVGQHGRGGHSHNDKLSYEFYANGIEYQRDPGTYVYTESQEWRNKFRSSLAHNSPYFGEEQNLIGVNCFELRQRTKCELLRLTNRLIQVSCKYGSIYVVRYFELTDKYLLITDFSNKEFTYKPVFEYFSNGYGKIISNKGEYKK